MPIGSICNNYLVIAALLFPSPFICQYTLLLIIIFSRKHQNLILLNEDNKLIRVLTPAEISM